MLNKNYNEKQLFASRNRIHKVCANVTVDNAIKMKKIITNSIDWMDDSPMATDYEKEQLKYAVGNANFSNLVAKIRNLEQQPLTVREKLAKVIKKWWCLK